jgi:alpha-galactosidase
MEIANEGVVVKADYDVGVREISSRTASLAAIAFPKFSVRYTLGKKSHSMKVGRPSAVNREGSQIEVLFEDRHGDLADRRVEASLTVDVETNSSAALLKLRITNHLHEPISLEEALLLDLDAEKKGSLTLGHGISEWRFFKQGFQSFSASGALSVNEKAWRPRLKFLRLMEENPTNPDPNRPGRFVSELVTQITHSSSGHAILVGFLGCTNAFGDIRLAVAPKKSKFLALQARCNFDGINLKPGESIETETLAVTFGAKSRNLLADWADWFGKEMNARVPERRPNGWCSWYYYYTRISEDEVLSNLSRLSELKNELPMDYVQIDDGYQNAIGDWLTTNDRFYSGMEDLANRIGDAGFSPGIWTAPFYARPRSQVFREHRDWFLRDRRGRLAKAGWNPLWGGRVHALDPTHPEVQMHLTQVYSELRRMGYRMFKCDFLYAAALPGKRYLESTTRAQALRIGLKTIREAIGDDSFLLGCGCPIGPAVGIVDAMRIGPDVAPQWSNPLMRNLLNDRNALCTRHSIVNTINRAFMHRRLFFNDPDCLLVRKNRNRMSLDEVRTLATVIALSGGMMVISDDMPKLSEERLDILRKVAAIETDGMRVVHPFASFEPDTLVSKSETGMLIGILNLSDKTVTRILDLKELMSMEELSEVREIEEFWTGKSVKHQNGLIRLGGLAPHCSRLFRMDLARKG